MDLQEASYQLSKECSRAINDWLDRCVRDFCPEAMERFQAGDMPGASAMLSRNGFHYESSPDSIYEFCQGDRVIARCKLEVKLGGGLTASDIRPLSSLLNPLDKFSS